MVIEVAWNTMNVLKFRTKTIIETSTEESLVNGAQVIVKWHKRFKLTRNSNASIIAIQF